MQFMYEKDVIIHRRMRVACGEETGLGDACQSGLHASKPIHYKSKTSRADKLLEQQSII